MSATEFGPACMTCRYYWQGECRRRAPVALDGGLVRDNADPHVCWPRVRRTDWCGDHERVVVPEVKP